MSVNTDYEAILKEFNEIPYSLPRTIDPSKLDPILYKTALGKENWGENRYGNVLPNETTRVQLPGGYYNANWIWNSRALAAQGPMFHQIGRFWEMVSITNAKAIVTLTNSFENGVGKCAEFWYNHSNEQVLFNTGNEKIIKREVRFLEDGNIRTITQFHLENWPDKQVVDIEALARIVEEVYEFTKANEKPFLAHCSAGVGRSGTFCAVFEAYRQMKEGNANPNIREIVEDLRHPNTGRIGMVQKPEQYLLVYQVVEYFIKNKFTLN